MIVLIIKYLILSMPGIMTYLFVMERSHIFENETSQQKNLISQSGQVKINPKL